LKLCNQKKNIILKKVFLIALSFLIMLPICGAMSFVGSCNSASITAEREVRAGHSYQVRLVLDSAATGYEGYFSYDASVLTLTRIVPVNSDLYQDFQVQTETGYVRVTHSSSVRQMLSLTFYVNENAKTNTEALIRFYSGKVINQASAESVADTSFRFLVVDRKSSDATLRGLDVVVYHSSSDRDQNSDGFFANLIPSFSSTHTTYSVTVPNEFSHYLVQPTVNDSTAKVTSVLKGELTEGVVNTVEVSVTAEDGSKKTYLLQMFRERAPEISVEPSEPSEDISLDESSETQSEESSELSDVSSIVESSADESEESNISFEDSFDESSVSEESSEQEISSAESDEETSSLVSDRSQSSLSSNEQASSDDRKPIDSKNLTGIFFAVAALSVLAIAVLFVRILYLVHKKRK